jgi:triacylglycerol lipase
MTTLSLALLLIVALALVAVGIGVAWQLWSHRLPPPTDDRPRLSARPVPEERAPSVPPSVGEPEDRAVEPAVPEAAPEEPRLLPPSKPPSAPPPVPPPAPATVEPVEDEAVEPIPLEPVAPPRSRRVPPPWYPVVLAHGVLGFDALRVGFLQPQYFRGVAKQLRSAGNEVYVVRVSPVAGIAVRAAQLAAQVRAIPAERVNVIAHSMGGLDARYAISQLGLADRVASLTTVGTPHYGTPLADSGVWLVHEQMRLRKLLEMLGIDAFSQLTTEHLETFNASVPDVSGVHYASCPARIGQGVRGVNSLLAPGYVLLEREIGDNDGVVPTASQRWGEVLDEIDADHWAQVGWSLGFDAVGFYDQLVRALRRRRL